MVRSVRPPACDRVPLGDRGRPGGLRAGQPPVIAGPTSEQGGRLTTIETPTDERALVLAPQTPALARIATRQKGGIVVEQTYVATDEAGPVTMDGLATYRGGDADELRA